MAGKQTFSSIIGTINPAFHVGNS